MVWVGFVWGRKGIRMDCFFSIRFVRFYLRRIKRRPVEKGRYQTKQKLIQTRNLENPILKTLPAVPTTILQLDCSGYFSTFASKF
jgi:hypothetical protein